MGLLDALGRGFEEWGSSELTDKMGPDWREQLAEREAQRQRAAEAEKAARISERMTLAEKLAQTAADAMEAEQAPGDAGQIGIGNYQVNLPTPPPPDYSGMLPEDLVKRTGMSREAILARARGKQKLSRRQLEILKEANRATRQERGFGYGRETREDQQAAALDRLNRTLKVRESEGAANRGLRRELHDTSEVQGTMTDHARSVAAALKQIRDESKQLEKAAAADPTIKYDPAERQAMEQELLSRAGMEEDISGRLLPTEGRPAPAAGVGPAPAAKPAGGAVTDVTSRAEVEALPDGATFRLRGKTYRKRGNTAVPVS